MLTISQGSWPSFNRIDLLQSEAESDDMSESRAMRRRPRRRRMPFAWRVEILRSIMSCSRFCMQSVLSTLDDQSHLTSRIVSKSASFQNIVVRISKECGFRECRLSESDRMIIFLKECLCRFEL